MEISQDPILKIRERSVAQSQDSLRCLVFICRGTYHCPAPFVINGTSCRMKNYQAHQRVG